MTAELLWQIFVVFVLFAIFLAIVWAGTPTGDLRRHDKEQHDKR